MTEVKKRYVKVEESSFNFLISECGEIHRILDMMEVPRHHEDGSGLSIAQRVGFYAGAMEVIYNEWLVLKGAEGEEEIPPPDTAH